MERIGCSQKDHNGEDIAYNRQHSNKENIYLTIRKVNLTWQQSTKMIGEHIRRQEKGLVEEEITPNRNDNHCTALHVCRNALK